MKQFYLAIFLFTVFWATLVHGETFCDVDLESGGRLKGFLVSENDRVLVINSNDMLLTLYKEKIKKISKREETPSLLNQKFNNAPRSIDVDYSSAEKRQILHKLFRDFKKYEKKRQDSIDRNDISAAIFYAKKMRRIAHQLKVKTGDADGMYGQTVETISNSIADLDSLFLYNKKWSK